jgi:hypothetical protein
MLQLPLQEFSWRLWQEVIGGSHVAGRHRPRNIVAILFRSRKASHTP